MYPLLSAIVICAIAVNVWTRHRDVLHPAVFTAPFFLMFYGIWPILINRNGAIDFLMDGRDSLELVFFSTVSVFYLSLAWGQNRDTVALEAYRDGELSRQSRRLLSIAVILGLISFVGWMAIIGGPQNFVRAYSVGKGGGIASSGVVGESTLLAYPAAIFLALHVRTAGRLRYWHILLCLVILSPHLAQGTLGGRRGPMFVSVFALVLCYFLATRKRLKPIHFIIPAIALPIAMTVLAANRQDIYIGSDAQLDFNRAWDNILPDDTKVQSNDYVHGLAIIAKANYYQDFYWGWRFFATLFLRPIPVEIWPDKWEFIDPVWLAELGDGYTFATATGFQSLAGASGGSIADGYQEFWWGVLVMFFALGQLMNWVWRRHRQLSGIWTVALCIMLVFSIYLPTQSFGAWAFRVMLSSLGFVVFWWLIKNLVPGNSMNVLQQQLGLNTRNVSERRQPKPGMPRQRLVRRS